MATPNGNLGHEKGAGVFTIQMIPATAGDCLLIQYGPEDAPHRILVDGGRVKTYTDHLRNILTTRFGDDPVFELLVVTHIDGDHIYGALGMLRDQTLPVTFRDIWFNGFRHLPGGATDALGPRQGDYLTTIITKRGLPWNRQWEGNAVATPSAKVLPTMTLAGGLRLTLLSPTLAGLGRLRPEWADYLAEAKKTGEQDAGPGDRLGRKRIDPNPDPQKLARAPFREDTSTANASSIALLAEYEGHRLLLAGDAFPSVLEAGLRAFGRVVGEERPRIDLMKISHHGGKSNTSVELLKAIDCRRFLISTDSSIFQHPDDETIGRVIVNSDTPTLYFNHETDVTKRWGKRTLRQQFRYEAVYLEGDGPETAVKVNGD